MSACCAYLIRFIIRHAVAEIVEVYRMVRKERLYKGNGVHIDVEVCRISRADKHELGEILALMESVNWKSKPGQHVRIIGIQRQFGN